MQALDGAFGQFLDTDAHGVPVDSDIKVDGDSAVVLVSVGTLPLIPTDCAMILGDVLQNFRAALDHLAWDLVKIGTNPHPKKPQDVYFPTARSTKTWRENVERWLPGVPKTQRRIIKKYQPYGRGNGAKAIRWLRNLSDADKHRVMTPVVMNVSQVNLSVTSNWTVSNLDYLVRRPQRLNVGTKLARAKFVRSGPDDCQVKVEGRLPLYPAVTYRRPLGDVLLGISETVLEILTEFDERL
jgi:hypothetical protein